MANHLTPTHSHSKSSFSMGREKYELQTSYAQLTIELSDKRKRENLFYIEMLNRWITKIKESGVRHNGEFLLIETIELLSYNASNFPFKLTRAYRVRLEIRRIRNQNADRLLTQWRENLTAITVSKYGAIIRLTKIEDI